MRLFNSFRNIYAEIEPISDLLTEHEKYLAHTHPKKESETLSEHIILVNEYALKLIEVNGLDKVVDNLISHLLSNQSKISNEIDFGNFIKRLFSQTIVFHDYGKVNHGFQCKRMDNREFCDKKNSVFASTHSKIGTLLYLTDNFKKLLEMSFTDFEKSVGYYLIIVFSFSILKHHSSYLEKGIEINNDELIIIDEFLEKFKITIEADYKNGFFNNISSIEKSFYEVFRFDVDTQKFPLFALLKLNFSLLTAADYYATSAYMNEWEIQDFGVINEKFREHIISQYRTKIEYNKELYEKLDYFTSIDISSITEKSNDNLNLLRQKLAAEIVMNVRENSTQNLFYLEAPTGAGKTNLSLAICTELMESNPELNKVFYVFPFTTLVTQTFTSIKYALGITDSEITQLHSKTGFHSKYETNHDGSYGKEKLNYVDNLFSHYPFVLLTHIKFFEILKGNLKESNYILHRLSNSVVIIDELQSYNPEHWDKIIWYLNNYSKHFNIKFILMSATLPYIGALLNESEEISIVRLVKNKDLYFRNTNFKDRVKFNFDLLNWSKPNSKEEREHYLLELKEFLFQKCNEFAKNNNNRVKCLIEFIFKKSASTFFHQLREDDLFDDYKIQLISGEILEPKKRQVINDIKENKHKKTIVVCTQTIEAGVDIDMDIGFKDKSLIDSDEQLAGRVNRNANPKNSFVYIFNLDREFYIYGTDKRYEVTLNEIPIEQYKEIIEDKLFNEILYSKVNDSILIRNQDQFTQNFSSYINNLKYLNFSNVNNEFKLIDDSNWNVFIPMEIPIELFEPNEIELTNNLFITDAQAEFVSGKKVFEHYINIVTNKNADFLVRQIDVKKIQSILCKFTFSIYNHTKSILAPYCDHEIEEQFGFLYMHKWEEIYSFEGGIDNEKLGKDIFL